MKMTIHTTEQLADASLWLRKVWQAHKGKPIAITIEPARPARSLAQNAKLRALLGQVATLVGYESTRELEGWCKADMYPRKTVSSGGRALSVPKNTDELTQEECSAVIAKLEAQVAQMGGG